MTQSALQDPEVQQRIAAENVAYIERKRDPPADRRTLRWRYVQEPWARQTCAIPDCGSEYFQCHHATYQLPRSQEILALVPLCPAHHRGFEFDIWPAARNQLSRSMATLLYVVHGDGLHNYPDWATPVLNLSMHSDQLSLWDPEVVP